MEAAIMYLHFFLMMTFHVQTMLSNPVPQPTFISFMNDRLKLCDVPFLEEIWNSDFSELVCDRNIVMSYNMSTIPLSNLEKFDFPVFLCTALLDVSNEMCTTAIRIKDHFEYLTVEQIKKNSVTNAPTFCDDMRGITLNASLPESKQMIEVFNGYMKNKTKCERVCINGNEVHPMCMYIYSMSNAMHNTKSVTSRNEVDIHSVKDGGAHPSLVKKVSQGLKTQLANIETLTVNGKNVQSTKSKPISAIVQVSGIPTSSVVPEDETSQVSIGQGAELMNDYEAAGVLHDHSNIKDAVPTEEKPAVPVPTVIKPVQTDPQTQDSLKRIGELQIGDKSTISEVHTDGISGQARKQNKEVPVTDEKHTQPEHVEPDIEKPSVTVKSDRLEETLPADQEETIAQPEIPDDLDLDQGEDLVDVTGQSESVYDNIPNEKAEVSHNAAVGKMPEEMDDGNRIYGHDRLAEAEESHFFAYFMTMIILCIIGYLVFHNKQKILALAVEGRSRKGTRRRPNTSGYRKLDSNLEEAVTSTCSTSVTHVIY